MGQKKYKYAVVLDVLRGRASFGEEVGYIIKNRNEGCNEVFVWEVPFYLTTEGKKMIGVKRQIFAPAEVCVIDEHDREIGSPLRSLRKNGERVKNERDMEKQKRLLLSEYSKKELHEYGWMFYQVFDTPAAAKKTVKKVFDRRIKETLLGPPTFVKTVVKHITRAKKIARCPIS